jgi:hypothetical protein
MARFARCDVRREAAAFVESDETTICGESAPLSTRFVGFSCRSAAANIARADRCYEPTTLKRAIGFSR